MRRGLAFALVWLITACGGGGGSDGAAPIDETPSEPPPTPDPTEPIVIVDSLPEADMTVSDSVSEFTIAHYGASDWEYAYESDCEPSGVAVRRQLVDMSDDTPYPEIVEHALSCALEPARDYSMHVDTTASDGTEHRASLDFTVDSAKQATEILTVDTKDLLDGDVGGLYDRFVRDAASNEIETAVIGSAAAAIVAQLAKSKWDEISSRSGRFGTRAEQVNYPSRNGDGGAANLSGLIVRPKIEDSASFAKASRVVVLSHSTGSHPSRLENSDPWYVLGNLLANRGYLVIAPDNWGNGGTAGEDAQGDTPREDGDAQGSVPETYMLASRVAATSLDMIDAVLDDPRYQSYFDPEQTVDLAVIGYSQGGHSGMALWLAHALRERGTSIREVYVGAGPYDLYGMLRGGLLRHAEECNNSPWCDIDEQKLRYYVERWTLPGYFQYLRTGLGSADILGEDGFTDEFITGFLDNAPKYDTLKALLQLNSFSNLLDLTGTVVATDTIFHLFHAEEDRTVPRQNSIELEDTLEPAFNVFLHSGECNGRLFDQLSNLDTGVVHSVCALEMFDRVLKDLQPSSQHSASTAPRDAGAPWRALAEERAQQALSDPTSLNELDGRWSSSELETMAANLEAVATPATLELAERLRDRVNRPAR